MRRSRRDALPEQHVCPRIDPEQFVGVLPGMGALAPRAQADLERARTGATADAKEVGTAAAQLAAAKTGMQMVAIGKLYFSTGDYANAVDAIQKGEPPAVMSRMVQVSVAADNKPMPPLSALSFEIKAPLSGTVVAIDNVQLARIARSAGAPRAKGSGVDLLVKLGAPVAQGQLLYRVYAAFPTELAFARQAFNDAVTAYNSYKQSFPPVLLAGAFGHQQDARLLEFADSAQIQAAPKVSF